jgi:multiple sugar transport system substrate-binding protein
MKSLFDRANTLLRTYFLLVILIACAACTTGSNNHIQETTQPTESNNGTSKPIVVDVWFHAGASPQRLVVQESLDRFNSTHDDIHVELIELPEGEYNDQVQRAASGAAIAGNLPCLLDFDGPYVYSYVWSGFLIPLDEYLTPEMKDDFLSTIIEQGTYQDGKLYSLGQFDGGLALWGNKEYLEKAGIRLPTVETPWTRDEFEDALTKLQALPEVKYALDLKMNYDLGLEFYTYAFSPILQSFGADLIDRRDYQSADGVLNGAEAIAAMNMIQGWFDAGYVNPNPPNDSEFINGNSALSWVGHWVWTPYQEALGDNLILLPMPDFGQGPKTGAGSWNWGITSQCEHPEAAWDVLEFMLDPDLILRQSDASGTIPARKSALNRSELFKSGGPLHLYIEQIEAGYAVPRPATPIYPVISEAFTTAFNNIIRGADVETELDLTVQAIDQAIQELRVP